MTRDQKSNARLVGVLKRRGGQTTAQLAAALGISVPAVRQHLRNLLESRQVTKTEVKRGVGRPAQVWTLAKQGHARFPDAHAELTVALVDSIRTVLGEEALAEVLQDRYRAAEERYREAVDGSSETGRRLAMLVDLRDAEGYMPEVVEEQRGVWLFVENHCPIRAAAQSCRGFCHNELKLFQTVLGDRVAVERVEYLLTGNRRCAYRITALSAPTDGGPKG